MQGFNYERIALLNSMSWVYISLEQKRLSMDCTWTLVDSLLYAALLEQGCGTKVTSQGPFQPQPVCDSLILYRIASPSCARIAFSWPGLFTLEATAVLSVAAECFLNSSSSELRMRVYVGRIKRVNKVFFSIS